MEAGLILRRLAVVMAVAVGLAAAPAWAQGIQTQHFRGRGGARPAGPQAVYATRNFRVSAATPDLARQVGDTAERLRNELALYWTGKALPNWPVQCPIFVVSGPQLAAQGLTNYKIEPVSDFQMEVIGTPQRILDSVLPHEVTHTVLASHFGRPLPRWADEGICTTVEHPSEKGKHEVKLREFLHSKRGIPMNHLFQLRDYPSDVLPMYAQGYSVCRFLIEQKGPRPFVQFLHDHMKRPSWTANIRKHYGYESLAELQDYWLDWVRSGSGQVDPYVKNRSSADTAIAQASAVDSQAPATRLIALPSKPQRNRVGGSESWYQRGGPASTVAANPTAKPTPAASVALNAPQTGQRSRSLTGPSGSVPSNANSRPNAMIPPSVQNPGRYSAAQPQPEQGLGVPSDYSRRDTSGRIWR